MRKIAFMNSKYIWYKLTGVVTDVFETYVMLELGVV
jgi:hypothetical protein